MALTAPPPATGYDAATTAAVKSVLIEVGQILGGFKDKFAVVGGSVPMLLLDNADMPHVGTMDVDLALEGRDKPKDAYDIYYSIRNFPGGIVAIAAATSSLMKVESAIEGYRKIGRKFAKPDFYGPASVRKFVEESGELGDFSPEQWQQDAFGQVDAWLRKIGLR